MTATAERPTVERPIGTSKKPTPLHLAAAAAAAGIIWRSVSPIDDIDSYWHEEIGGEILDRHTLHGLGTQWLGVRPPTSWLTSQWAAEVSMHQLVNIFGYKSLILVRLLSLLAIILISGFFVLRGRPAILGVPVAILCWLTVAPSVQDRPQTLSFVFIALLAGLVSNILREGKTASPWLIAAGVVVWAQFHGLWVLAPAAFGLAAACTWLDRSHLPAGTYRRALLATAATCAGVFNPQGLVSFALPFRLAAATGIIGEWKPTNISNVYVWPFVILAAATIWAWTRSSPPAPRGEVLHVLVWLTFSLMAFRNVAPAMLMIAPVSATAITRVWGAAASRWTRRTSERESRVLLALGGTVMLCALATSVGRVASLDPLSRLPGRHIAQWVATQDHPIRIFNAYNTASALLAFGNGNARLAVDGRADMWGGDYLDRLKKVADLSPGWQKTVGDFRPDAVVAVKNTALANLLVERKTWRPVITDGSYVLLVPTTS